MGKLKIMPLFSRMAMFASPRQAILTLKNRGTIIDQDGCALMAFATIAALVAKRTGYNLTSDPVRALLEEVDSGSVAEESIEAAHDMIEAAWIMSGIVAHDEWIKATRDVQIAVEVDALND
jgi:hypothetical protein